MKKTPTPYTVITEYPYVNDADGDKDMPYATINGGRWGWIKRDHQGFHLTGIIEPSDAEFIVRACNCHDELVSALEGFLNMAKAYGWNELPDCRGTLLQDAKTLLEKAKGGEQ